MGRPSLGNNRLINVSIRLPPRVRAAYKDEGDTTFMREVLVAYAEQHLLSQPERKT
jgi:hypothetical protein